MLQYGTTVAGMQRCYAAGRDRMKKTDGSCDNVSAVVVMRVMKRTVFVVVQLQSVL
jgi:hypothetical protein